MQLAVMAPPDTSTEPGRTEPGRAEPGPAWPAPDPTARRRAPRTRRVLVLTIVATVLAFASTAIGNEAVVAIAALFVISWPLERIWRRHPVPVRRLALRTDLAYAVASPLLQSIGLVLALVVGALSFAWLPGLAVRPLVELLPGWVGTMVGILLFDALVYWTHRWSHTVPFFWRFHAVHHSTRHLDWVSGFRAHPFDGAFIAPAFAFVLAAGFDPAITGALAIVQFVVGIWSHLNVRWRLRPLRHIVLTPDFHHWHHANEPEAINTNFSTLLPIWDILFGTFRMPDGAGPQRYGVDEDVPLTVGRQLLYPFRRRPRQTHDPVLVGPTTPVTPLATGPEGPTTEVSGHTGHSWLAPPLPVAPAAPGDGVPGAGSAG